MEPKLKTVPNTKAEEVAESLSAIEGELCGLSGVIECIEKALDGEPRADKGSALVAVCHVGDRISALREDISECAAELRK